MLPFLYRFSPSLAMRSIEFVVPFKICFLIAKLNSLIYPWIWISHLTSSMHCTWEIFVIFKTFSPVIGPLVICVSIWFVGYSVITSSHLEFRNEIQLLVQLYFHPLLSSLISLFHTSNVDHYQFLIRFARLSPKGCLINSLLASSQHSFKFFVSVINLHSLSKKIIS